MLRPSLLLWNSKAGRWKCWTVSIRACLCQSYHTQTLLPRCFTDWLLTCKPCLLTATPAGISYNTPPGRCSVRERERNGSGKGRDEKGMRQRGKGLCPINLDSLHAPCCENVSYTKTTQVYCAPCPVNSSSSSGAVASPWFGAGWTRN